MLWLGAALANLTSPANSHDLPHSKAEGGKEGRARIANCRSLRPGENEALVKYPNYVHSLACMRVGRGRRTNGWMHAFECGV